jgi:hypothetical protein
MGQVNSRWVNLRQVRPGLAILGQVGQVRLCYAMLCNAYTG